MRGALVATLLVACSSPLSRAKTDFRQGDLERAKSELLALEPDVPGMPLQGRAEYALYRGLVHTALGDRASARTWLSHAKVIEDEHPQTLRRDDFTRLTLALQSLDAIAPEAGP